LKIQYSIFYHVVISIFNSTSIEAAPVGTEIDFLGADNAPPESSSRDEQHLNKPSMKYVLD
jgi:hypothetical protein